MNVIYDGLAPGRTTPLLRVDQLTANRAGEVFVCEDIATDEIDIGLIDAAGRVSKFLSATGPDRRVGAHWGDVRPVRWPHVLLIAARSARASSPGPGAIYECPARFVVHAHRTRGT